MSGLTPPSKYYRGPVTGINRGCSYPYDSDEHCASCGSTSVSSPSYRDGITSFRCNRCGRRTRISNEPPSVKARYDIVKEGYTERESLAFSKLDFALWEVLTDLDVHYLSEKASEYYGDYYDSLGDDMFEDDVGAAEERNSLEMDLPWVNKCMALEEGYVYGLEVGEEYNLPDFPVSVVRVEDAKSGSAAKSNAGKPAKPKASGNRRTTASRRTASKPKTSKNVKKTPAKKTTKPKTRASARSTSRRY